MIGFLDSLKMGGGIALGVMISAAPLYLYGKSVGKQESAIDALENSVVVLRERNEIDAEISRSDASKLCDSYFLPGSDEHGECVRRLAETDPNAGNGGEDRHGR